MLLFGYLGVRNRGQNGNPCLFNWNVVSPMAVVHLFVWLMAQPGSALPANLMGITDQLAVNSHLATIAFPFFMGACEIVLPSCSFFNCACYEATVYDAHPHRTHTHIETHTHTHILMS